MIITMFHTHLFTPSEKDSDILYCRCGQTRDLHRHIWEEVDDIFKMRLGEKHTIGRLLKCKVCGDLKPVDINE